MRNNYNLIRSLSKEEFEREGISLEDPDLKEALPEEIEAVERLLDVQPGTLQRDKGPYLFASFTCRCGHKINVYDFVFTALIDAEHTKSFILHALLGIKYVIAPEAHRFIRCSSCGLLIPDLDSDNDKFLWGNPNKYAIRNYKCKPK